jgi:hypothetical protein
MQLRISLNIPLKDIQSDDVEQDEIPTLLRFFTEGNQSDLYKLNTFICEERMEKGGVGNWRV